MSEDKTKAGADQSQNGEVRSYSIGAKLSACAICLAVPLIAIALVGLNGGVASAGFIGIVAQFIQGIFFFVYDAAGYLLSLVFGLIKALGSLLGVLGIFPYFAVCFYVSKRALTMKGHVWGNKWADLACTIVATASLFLMGSTIPETVILDYLDHQEIGSIIWDPGLVSYLFLLLTVIAVLSTDSLSMFTFGASKETRAASIKKADADYLMAPVCVIFLLIVSVVSVIDRPDMEVRKLFQLTDQSDPSFADQHQKIIEETLPTAIDNKIQRAHFVQLDKLEVLKREWEKDVFYVVHSEHKTALSCKTEEGGKVAEIKLGTYIGGIFAREGGWYSEYSLHLYTWVCAVKMKEAA